MSLKVFPAVAAVLGGMVLAFVLLVPFVFRSYRRRGELGWGPTILAFGFLVYGLALVTYTLLPLPSIDAAWCSAHQALAQPQLDPLRFLADIAKEQQAPGLRGLLVNPALQQVVFNVALFVPLGAYLTHYLRRGVGWVVLAGFGVSLLIELTQLTGNWFAFECPYRIFDVDDLIANTVGAAFGVLLAPLLRFLDGPKTTVSAEEPRPVTTARRLLGMLVDLVSVTVLGGALGVTANLVAHFGFDVWLNQLSWGQSLLTVLSTWLPAVVLLAVPALAGGATTGQRAVRLRRIGADGSAPGARIVVALMFGSFGYFAFSSLGQNVPMADILAQLLLLGALVCAWRPRSHPGLSGLVSGLVVVDARSVEQPQEASR
ncbi:VanZ family protein [Allokutzneria oryzae]|uniref:VanZ family protein n=1 Tax=Allokutzneria oryzae TaxID=1378989 RepID=A0ABV6A000_9PSEU